MANGRLMVNCGGADYNSAQISSINGVWVKNSTLKALCRAFPGQVGNFLHYYYYYDAKALYIFY